MVERMVLVKEEEERWWRRRVEGEEDRVLIENETGDEGVEGVFVESMRVVRR